MGEGEEGRQEEGNGGVAKLGKRTSLDSSKEREQKKREKTERNKDFNLSSQILYSTKYRMNSIKTTLLASPP